MMNFDEDNAVPAFICIVSLIGGFGFGIWQQSIGAGIVGCIVTFGMLFFLWIYDEK